MGLNVGGIYVRHADHQRVANAIKDFWLGIGATPLAAASDALALEPLSVQKTGKLGYAVFPPTPSSDGETWVAVYDSERYHGSHELAKALAKALATEVVIYQFSGSVDEASMRVFGSGKAKTSGLVDSDDWGEVETAIGGLPYAATYYNKLREANEGMEDVAVFGFEAVPYRDSDYRGPSVDELAAAARLIEVEEAVGRGDVDVVRRLYDAHPTERYAFLSKVTDPFRSHGAPLLEAHEPPLPRRVLFAMADELLADPSAYWNVRALTETAYLAGEKEIFKRGAVAMGERVASLDALGSTLLQDKRTSEGIELLRLVVSSPAASLTSFNNLAWGLIAANPLPDDTTALLEICESHGPANPHIFHNTACVWVRLGKHERAIAAVRAAVEAGYTAIADMRVDKDLAPLFDDPAFIAAFAPPGAIDLASLVVTREHRGKTYVLQRPLLVFEFFLEMLPARVVCPAMAALVDAYLADIPTGALTMARRNGPWKPLSKATMTRDLNKLRKGEVTDLIRLDYRGATDDSGGAPTEYGVSLETWGDEEDSRVPSVAVWFPATMANEAPDVVAARFARYTALVPAEAAGAGVRVMLRQSDYVETWWERHLLGERIGTFLGSEDHPSRDWSPGSTAGATWLSFVASKLVTKLGGTEALNAAVSPASVVESAGGLFIRASDKPGLGAGRPPTDLGALPKVARAFYPLAPTHKVAHAKERLAAHYGRLLQLA